MVKLDGSVTTPALGDAKARRVLAAVLAVARAADRETIAEGIETGPQLELARELGFDGGQGFLLGAAGAGGRARRVARFPKALMEQ